MSWGLSTDVPGCSSHPPRDAENAASWYDAGMILDAAGCVRVRIAVLVDGRVAQPGLKPLTMRGNST